MKTQIAAKYALKFFTIGRNWPVFLLAAFLLTGCPSGGSDDDGNRLALGTVGPLYLANGANWNDYIDNDVANAFGASGSACSGTGTGYNSCLHGGEMRTVGVTGKTSCSGLTASDALGAFNWVCDASTGSARMISTGLRDGKFLSDLIDFTAPGGWKDNSVTVSDGTGKTGKTASSAWWSNLMEIRNDTDANNVENLGTSGTVYLVTASPSADYTISADKVALVVEPGVRLDGAGLPTSVLVSALSVDFLWVEGVLGDTTNSEDRGLSFDTVTHSVVRGLEVSEGSVDSGAGGVYLSGSSNNMLSHIMATKNEDGIYLVNSSNNTLSNINASANISVGISLEGSSNNIFADVTVANMGFSSGVRFSASSDNNALLNITAANNDNYGIQLSGSSNNTLSNTITINNGTYGVYLLSASNNTVSNVVAAYNSTANVSLNDASNNTFTDLFKVDGNGTDCSVTGGTNPGLDNACNPTDSSDFTLRPSVSMTASFVGMVTQNDLINTSDTNGMALYSDTLDLNFDNAYRHWGPDGLAFPSLGNIGTCDSGTCRIWDWSLANGDTGDSGVPVALEVMPVPPTGDEVLEHRWLGVAANQEYCNTQFPGSIFNVINNDCRTTFLRRSVEILGDGIGNENLLCESGETCLYSHNIGSYQGHGNLISAGTFTGGTLTGITLMKYQNNGRPPQP